MCGGNFLFWDFQVGGGLFGGSLFEGIFLVQQSPKPNVWVWLNRNCYEYRHRHRHRHRHDVNICYERDWNQLRILASIRQVNLLQLSTQRNKVLYYFWVRVVMMMLMILILLLPPQKEVCDDGV